MITSILNHHVGAVEVVVRESQGTSWLSLRCREDGGETVEFTVFPSSGNAYELLGQLADSARAELARHLVRRLKAE